MPPGTSFDRARPGPGGQIGAGDLDAGAAPQEIVAWTYRGFERVALVASFQVESIVLIHMAVALGIRPRVVTLDTGRLPAETLAYIEDVSRDFDLDLQIERPDSLAVEEMVSTHGRDLFRRSVELRHACCEVRKVRPLAAALSGYQAWITGLRRDQSSTRLGTPITELDQAHGGLLKVAPLAAWSASEVWTYVEANRLRVHPLYAQNYTSIGCAPCTRATRPGEDQRAGRWWWEMGAVKECGLHPTREAGR
ncbi:MAG: phosphoadenylyl-sulfate reductase [Candidatus Dormibacteraceae bacterium]